MRNLPHKVTGDDLTADEFNDIPEEEENLITSTGQALTAGDLYQMAKAVAQYCAVGDFYADSGAANAYVLTAVSPLQAPHQYMDGMRVRFRISHTNTGPATVNVNTLGVKTIVKEDGVSPVGEGDLPIGEHGELIFHADINSFELYSHKSQSETAVTGEIKVIPSNAPISGWLLMGDLTSAPTQTIGSATSGADVRANADCEGLFKFLWNNILDAYCPVVGGRGASANADWTANKKIRLFYIDGNAIAAQRWGVDPIGSFEGERTHIITTTEMPSHPHSISDPGHAHSISDPTHQHGAPTGLGGGGGTNRFSGGDNVQASVTSSNPTGIGIYGAATNISIVAAGGGAAHNNMQPTMKFALFIKL